MIVTLTLNPAVDRSSSVDRVVAERKMRCARPVVEPGGGGINVSRAVHRLGGETRAVFPAGGHSGALLCSLLDDEGLAQHPVEVDAATRLNLMVVEEDSGQQYRFGMPGAPLEERDWRRCLAVLDSIDPQPSWVVASGSMPPGVPDDLLARVARWGRSRQVRVAVDSSGEPLRQAAAAGVDLLKPNMRELRQLAGSEINNETQQEEAARRLVGEHGSRLVVVSLGAAGAILVAGDRCQRLRAPSVPIRSKVGAGDSMMAGIVLGLERGLAVDDAVHFGIAAGAAAVMTPGSALCQRDDTERLYRSLTAD